MNDFSTLFLERGEGVSPLCYDLPGGGLEVFEVNLLCRQMRGRMACPAILAAITMALVACGAGPGATKTQDPVGFKNIELRQGSTSEISLVNTFSGSELTYSATSSDTSKVKVAVDNDKDTLTVEAVSPGTATITVTAKNPQGSHSQTFTVTVPQPEEEEEEAAPTVRSGARASVDVDQGETETVTLSRVFTGEALEFSVSSSDTDVATASIDDDEILTISARSPGKATITVTATNDDGNAAHRITVTVPTPVTATPEPPTTSSTLTIKLGESAKRTLPGTQTLKKPDLGGVAVEKNPDGETGNVWLITATRKGTHTITISSGAANPEKVGSFVVVVPNSPPARKAGNHPGPTSAPVKNADGFYTVTISPGLETYFTDDDATKADNDGDGDIDSDDAVGLAEILDYSIANIHDLVLIDAKAGFVATAGGTLTIEVLEKVKEAFKVSIYAHDDSGAKSMRPVIITVSPPSSDESSFIPRGRTYDPQQGSNGALGSEKVGPRIGGADNIHTLKFVHDDQGFIFANKLVKKYVDSGHLLSSPLSSDQPTTASTDNPIPVGAHFFTLRCGGSVDDECAWATDSGLAGDPTVMFKLTGKGSGWIEIEYKVWVSDKEKGDNGNFPDGYKPTPKMDRRRLIVNVVTCSSPPDPIDDCP